MNNIHIKHPVKVEEKIHAIKKSGPASFHVVADFDRTLTKMYGADGEKIISSYALIRKGEYLSVDFVARSHALFDEYYPYEQSTTLSLEEKSLKMVEWWTKHYELMVECGMQKKIIEEIVGKEQMQEREGFDEFMALLEKNEVPCLIFSAGQGDMIKEFLKHKKKLTSNVHLVSNFYTFDDTGTVVGYETPFIHTFNKSEVAIKDTPYYQDITEHKHVILLGDNIADLDMSNGIKHETIITIGFCNIPEKKKEYEEKYDVVILNDGSLEYVNGLLTDLLSSQ
jgi:cytosolic 5'-nucleotidase 3